MIQSRLFFFTIFSKHIVSVDFVSRSSGFSLSKMDLETNSMQRVCYLRPEENFPLDLIFELNLCTHLILGFFSINEDSTLRIEAFQDEFLRKLSNLIFLQRSNIKLMISIGAGGWKMAISSDSERTKFVKSIRSIIELYGLDGVDIDWEFPAWPPLKSPISERYDFVELLQSIRKELNALKRSILDTFF
ncbi:hypothetical protein SSS_08819 [Sarcoptes scabiei]|nr:hypothetical protein SSS_08819 [Sarcoptes scabiei]